MPASLSARHLHGTVNFQSATANAKQLTANDTVAFSGVLNGIPASPTLNGQTLSININGAAESFVLDGKDRAHTPNGSASVKLIKNSAGSTAAKIGVTLTHGNWAGSWYLNFATSGKSVTDIPITIEFGAQRCAIDVQAHCTSQAHKHAAIRN